MLKVNMKKATPLRVIMLPLILLLITGKPVSASGSSPAFYQRHRESMTCGITIKSAEAHSLTACSSICNQEPECIGFNLEVHRKPQRVCLLTKTSTPCVQNSEFNFYLNPNIVEASTTSTTTTTTTTEAPEVTMDCGRAVTHMALVGVTLNSHRFYITSVVQRSITLTTDHERESYGEYCGADRVITQPECSYVPTYKCTILGSGATVTTSSSSCKEVKMQNGNTEYLCPTDMAVVKIHISSHRLTGLYCCPVIGW